jgi:hypothetical protein
VAKNLFEVRPRGSDKMLCHFGLDGEAGCRDVEALNRGRLCRASFSTCQTGIEALAALALAVLTYRTLVVLRDYAADTKTIAKVSLSQAENMQKPFLALLAKPQELNRHGGG